MRVLGEFRRKGDVIERRFTGSERKMIGNLANGLAETMAAADDPAAADDVVLQRLLPDAVPGDPEASAEFSDATRERLAAAKAEGAQRVVADLDAAPGGVVRLDQQGAIVWVKALGDLRIALAERVGIEHLQHATTPQGLVYAWLTWLQGSLIDALDTP
ncbi:DUF2017 family protein [Amnibacterium sp.]|uniref:DUF2017 family protein n=1 Tax=Amnibacterium sp. TaxID=1872496 RepID=UPI003F7C191F